MKKYNIGLDIGTNSIGFAAVDDNNKLIKAKGKKVIGVRLFEEGKTAADRRLFRTTRRRLSRRRWRLRLLNNIFDNEIAKVDPAFFKRLKYSNTVKNNKEAILFPNYDNGDKSFYEEYPTIYHLRKKLMEEDRKFDIREIYLAVHHIVKYRGNFLNSASMDTFNNSQINIVDKFSEMNEVYQNIEDCKLKINEDNLSQVQDVLFSADIKKTDKQKQIKKILPLLSNDKNITNIKEIRNIQSSMATHIAKALLGYKFDLSAILSIDTDDDWKLEMSDEDIDNKLEEKIGDLDENRKQIVEILKSIYSSVVLKEILGKHDSISAAMVESFNDHQKHLVLLKSVISNMDDRKKAKALQNVYNQYVGKTDAKILKIDEFYKKIKNNLDDSSTSAEILDLIDKDLFMPKQRTVKNGTIPHQIHEKELEKILENQSKYYPFLGELNPNEKRSHQAKYKISELVAFKVPYYVGPLVTKESGNSQFAWMVRRKNNEEITPWNFEEQVDKIESANAFIKRMTTKDTYLLSEDVLPATSLIYQKFTVLNELNNIRINGSKLSVGEKQEIFNGLFKENKAVTAKKLKHFIGEKVKITGLADPQKFNNTYGTYIDLKKIIDDNVDDLNKQTDIEKIIEWSTVFEDRDIFAEKLKEITWLGDSQRNKLSNKRYQGWGRLSKKLLTGLKDDNGNSILDLMWSSKENFMQLVTRDDFARLISIENDKLLKPNDNKNEAELVEEVLDKAYTSPQNKKAIRQVIKVVEDIEKAMGYAPSKISLEFAKGPERVGRRSVSRYNQVTKMYEKISDEVSSAMQSELKEYKDKNLNDKLFLYFTQLGRDMYTGKNINIDDLANYDIDHILPQSFIKDDSLHNRVLTARAVNNGKSDTVPVKMASGEIKAVWNELKEKGLISKQKYNNLMTDPDNISKFGMKGFIRRQLVETRQVIKLAAQILGNKYQENTKILEVPAKLTHEMREMFDFIKIREVNDFHHGFDAYLSIFIGNYLYDIYPKLKSFFVFDDFKKFDAGKDGKNLKKFNFLYQLKPDKDNKFKTIPNPETGEIVWDKEMFEYVRKVYLYKFMLTSREVYSQHGALYNQTIYKASNTKAAIPVKNNRPVDIYGGYSGNTDAYMAIIAKADKKETKYQVVGIPTRNVDKLNQLKQQSNDEYEKYLHKAIYDVLAGTKHKKVPSFDVLLDKVYYKQLINDENQLFNLGSSTYKHNARQLILSEKSIKTLNKDAKCKDEHFDQDLNDVYIEILTQVNKYFSLYSMNKFIKKLNDGLEKFELLNVEDTFKGTKRISGKISTLREILNGLHANATFGNLKNIGFSTSFGQLQVPAGITLSKNAKLIFQSPTGLFERKIRISDL